MSRRLVACLVILSLLLPVASGGTQEDPELTDPAGDAAVDRECSHEDALCNAAPAGGTAEADDTADLLAVWVTEPNATAYTIHIQTASAGGSANAYAVSYNVTPTDLSLYTGVEEHVISFTVEGDVSADAPNNTVIARDGAVLSVTLTRADTEAVGGDSITSLAVTATHETSGDVGGTLTWTDTTTDATEGESRPYNLTRPPPVADMELEAAGGHFTQTVNGTDVTRSFTGSQADIGLGNATVTYNLTLINAGTDPDTATLSVFDPTGTLAGKNITASVTPTTTAELLPGATVQVQFVAQLAGTPGGEHILLVSAESARGGAAAAALTVNVPAPPVTPPPAPPVDDGDEEPAEREPVIAGLGFLTPMAEALAFDEAFGEWAEVVLLALLLLLVILIVFLAVFLATRRAVVVDVHPRTIEARPGETAEFTLNVRNRKRRRLDAVTQFEGDPAWSTSMAFGDAEMAQQHTDARLGLGPKGADSGTRTGKLRITVPDTAGDKEMDRVTVAVAALDADGRPKRRREATVRVRAREGAVAAGLPMRLSSVEHDPQEPEVGDTVTTTARLENDSEDESLHLRVVLNVDGDDVQEQPVVLPPRSARAVRFTWQVPKGSSKVRVRVFPQD